MPEHREPEATYERTIARLTAQRDALAAAVLGYAAEHDADAPISPCFCDLCRAARAALDALEEA